MGIAYYKQNIAKKVIINCEPNVEAGDYVYINSNNIAGLADASSIDTMPCVGYVTDVNNNMASITQFYIESGLNEIENRRNYFISDTVAGAIQEDQPNGIHTVAQVVAQGIGTTSILITIDPDSAIINNS